MRVVVVGAGVVGLTCAVRLAEAGHETHVLARDLPPETTSAVAAASGTPTARSPIDRVLGWSARTHDVLRELADRPGTGVTVRPGVELLGPGAPDEPWWRAAVPALEDVRTRPPGTGAAGGSSSRWRRWTCTWPTSCPGSRRPGEP